MVAEERAETIWVVGTVGDARSREAIGESQVINRAVVSDWSTYIDELGTPVVVDDGYRAATTSSWALASTRALERTTACAAPLDTATAGAVGRILAGITIVAGDTQEAVDAVHTVEISWQPNGVAVVVCCAALGANPSPGIGIAETQPVAAVGPPGAAVTELAVIPSLTDVRI